MTSWDDFTIFALISIVIWASGAILAALGKRRQTAIILFSLGIVIFAMFICGFWIELQRPPMRTMGETRLWYSFFMAIAGLFTFCRWKYKWILSFSTILSSVFILINIARPEIHSQYLPDILQSGWFIPHVTIYMFSYAFLGCSFLLALAGLINKNNSFREKLIHSTDELIQIGLSLFTIGMLFGALWAKQAWGSYWTWDPKETWALVTFLMYTLYLHLRHYWIITKHHLFILIIFSFLSLQICWWGVNYLPNSKESVHTYSINQ